MDQQSASQYLTFTLSGELFAVPIGQVREVIEYGGITEVPSAPVAVPGVINLRGAVVPVVNLSVRFGQGRRAPGPKTCIIVVEVVKESDDAPDTLGVIVDGVNEAVEVRDDEIEKRPAFGAGIRADFVARMLSLDLGFVPVLDLTRVLSIAELEGSAETTPEMPHHEIVA